MMKCIAIDDSANALELIKIHIDNTPFLELIETFQSAPAALKVLSSENIDLVFIDIEMPEISGLQFVRTLKSKPLIVFTTAYPNYAIEGFEVNAVDYLLKPISFEKFLGAANKAYELFRLKYGNPSVEVVNTKPDYLVFKSGNDLHRVNPEELTYLESKGNYIQLTLTKKNSIMSLMTMNEVMTKLAGLKFCRTHRGFIVNLEHISKVTHHEVHLGKHIVPLSKTYKSDLVKALEGGTSGIK